jgi:hypothetical protein
MRSLMIFLLVSYYWDDEIRDHEVDSACGIRGREESDTGFWWEKLMEGVHLEYLGIHGRITLKWILKQYDGKTWTGFIWL